MSDDEDGVAGGAPGMAERDGEARPYSGLSQELILRDHLAIDRTILANERTFLAYVRTGLAFFIAALALIRLFDDIRVQVIGYVMIPAGIATLMIGAVRYIKMHRAASSARQPDRPGR